MITYDEFQQEFEWLLNEVVNVRVMCDRLVLEHQLDRVGVSFRMHRFMPLNKDLMVNESGDLAVVACCHMAPTNPSTELDELLHAASSAHESIMAFYALETEPVYHVVRRFVFKGELHIAVFYRGIIDIWSIKSDDVIEVVIAEYVSALSSCMKDDTGVFGQVHLVSIVASHLTTYLPWSGWSISKDMLAKLKACAAGAMHISDISEDFDKDDQVWGVVHKMSEKGEYFYDAYYHFIDALRRLKSHA